MAPGILLLRLEGPMQAWGSHESQFGMRRTYEAPSRSGVMGLLCAALGVPRPEAGVRLERLESLQMGVRVDGPGVRWWDYQTVGAGRQMPIAELAGKTKPGPMLSRREYLCDASFLVALAGDAELVAELAEATAHPFWTPFLGRKSCPPSRPLLEPCPPGCADAEAALCAAPYRRRLPGDPIPATVALLREWAPKPEEPEAPNHAEVWYDMPVSLEPPVHRARLVTRTDAAVGADGIPVGPARQRPAPPPRRPRADYADTEYKRRRLERLRLDEGLCVFCKAPGNTVQHVTYRRAGGGETVEDLRALCRLCHDAVTMIEYGLGMGLDRIDPCEARWRERIISSRSGILQQRSLEARRRRLQSREAE
jgi:CRISPR system Cascade subunit CasD